MKQKENMTIAIDGPAGSGKSTVAKIIAKNLKFRFLDTGAIYRAVALKSIIERISSKDERALAEMMDKTKIILENIEDETKVLLDNKDVSKEIRTEAVSEASSAVAVHPEVRKRVKIIQRDFASKGNTVCEGRDMGAEVFPEAKYKFYLDASVEERAKRRYKEYLKIDEEINIEKIKEDIEFRDKQDSTRKASPLRKAKDAIVVDTTNLNIQEVVEVILSIIREKQA